MSEEEAEELKKASKKAPKKRVAKKATAKKAPKKKVIKKDSGAGDEASKASSEPENIVEKSKDEVSSPRANAQAKEPSIAVVEESPAETSDKSQEPRGPKRRVRGSRRGGNRDGERQERGPKRAIDAQEAAAKAWEIYQGELEEEGVSLVDGRRGRELARRCLELATVFCEERDYYISRQQRPSGRNPQNRGDEAKAEESVTEAKSKSDAGKSESSEVGADEAGES